MSQHAQDVRGVPGDAADVTDADVRAARIDGTPTSARLDPRWGAPIGVAAGLLGLLPWLITGMRMPLQNLWATEVLPRGMPTVWLPFSQYALVLLIGLLVTGGAAAGLAARLIGARIGRRGAPAMFLGTIVVQLIALTQTFLVARAGLVHSTTATAYLGR